MKLPRLSCEMRSANSSQCRVSLARTALAAIALGACTTNPAPVTVPEPGAQQAGASAPRPSGITLYARFTVDLAVSGDLRPGEPIYFQVTARGLYPTEDVEIRLMLPQVAAARLSSWDNMRTPVGTPLPPEGLWRTALPAGVTVTREDTVTIPRAGYYMAVASVFKKSDEPGYIDRKMVTDVAHKEIWLWIDPKGGRTTAEFERSIFPPGYNPQPGPARRVGERRP